MYEVVDEEELGRYVVIDDFDIIAWDSNDIQECISIYNNLGGKYVFRGIYDRIKKEYIEIDAD